MKLLEKINAGEIYYIAELSANHAGSLEIAKETVKAAADAGADCIKVQTYTADSMTIDSDKPQFKIEGTLWDGFNLYDLYAKGSLPYEWHEEIFDTARACGIDFLSTPFDEHAVDFLDGLGVEAYKIASFEITHIPLLKYAASKGKPVLLSTGMAALREIDEALLALRGCPQVILLKCTSEYPAPPESLNLATITDMKRRFNVPVGFSDHTAANKAASGAAFLGACVIEKHFCLSREIESPDSAFSLEPEEFAQMRKAADSANIMRGRVYYGATKEEKNNLKFRRSVFAKKDIEKGGILTKDNIAVVRPSGGAEPKYYPELLGTRANRKITAGDPVLIKDIIKEDL